MLFSFKKLTIFILSLLLSVLIMELLLRYFNYPYIGCKEVMTPSETFFGEFNANTGWSYKKNYTFNSTPDVIYNFNQNGYRTASVSTTINPDKNKIVFIGDSITFGEGVAYENTYVGIIEKVLGNRYEVINLGVQGFGTTQSYELLKENIEILKPDYVIYTFIPDHNLRNINFDRRLVNECMAFLGTKPIYEIDEGKIKKIASPVEIHQYDSVRVLLLLRHAYQRFRYSEWQRSGEDVAITTQLVKEIEELSEIYQAENLYIYYDNTYDDSKNNFHYWLINEIFPSKKIVPFYNWAKDSAEGDYYIPNDTYHPNEKMHLELAINFFQTYQEEFGISAADWQDILILNDDQNQLGAQSPTK